jgi:hypothetical protein
VPINPDDYTTWTLEQLLEHGSTAELEELLANTGPDGLDRIEASSIAASSIADELERRRKAGLTAGPTPHDAAATALTITEAMQAMTAGLPWVPGDVELDHELELIAGAMHLLAARATERRTELAGDVAASVGRSAAELAAIRERFGVNVAVLIAEGNR